MAKKKLTYLYKLLLLVASGVFIYFLFKQLGTLSKAVDLLSKGSWYFILAVLLIQFLSVVNRGAFYHTLYDFFGVKDSLRRLIILSLSSNFINLAAPTGGLSGMAVFISEAQRHGLSKSRSTFVNVFAYFLYYAVFVLLLLFGLFYLLFNHQIYKYQIITAAILFGMIFIILIALVAALEEAARVKKLFNFVAALMNFFTRLFGRRNIIGKADIYLASSEVSQCLKIISSKWRALWLPIFHVFLIELIDILTLYYLFLAFKFPIYPGILITTYAIGVLFTLVSITPGGIGVVEAAMIFVLTNLQVPVELSTIVIFGYRILNYWVPFGLGFIAFRKFQSEKIMRIENDAS